MSNPLPYLERLPKTGVLSHAPVLFLLHGRAAKAETIFSIEGLLDPSFHVISIRATYDSPKGEYEWFLPYDYSHPIETFTEDRFAESEQLLTKQIEAMMTEREISNERLFLSGFSQGAAMSHILSLRGKLHPKGVIPMSGFFPRPVTHWPLPTMLPSYLITHGTRDEVLPTSESKVAVEFYKEKNADVEYYEYNGRHKMTIPLVKKINEWIIAHK
jgi:phospholipase/carboxylesterase